MFSLISALIRSLHRIFSSRLPVKDRMDQPLYAMDQPGPPVSFPLDSLRELEDRSYFQSFHLPFNKCSVPLTTRTSQEKRPRLLVCHDMQGGYGDDKWIQGSSNSEAYSLWHWHLIDIFVYFSHHLVTIPPPCWTNVAHRHGVQVLGTFITEWDAGRAICKQLLDSKESALMYASRLAELAAVLGFDGWLLNIENKVGEEHVDTLLAFIQALTCHMHQSVPGSVVLWYDSVTKDGKLNWQNCLNDMNECYFDVCDGIFTNYTWKKEDPSRSALKAGTRRYDVYMGVDVFGRNTYGGGGFQSNVALNIAREADVSAAIFAPGWVFETKQGPSFSAAQNRWWGLIADCWPSAQHYPTKLPFFSDFDQGFGDKLYLKGSEVSGSPWSNLSCQHLQPVLHSMPGCKGGIQAVVSQDGPVYNGGASLKISGEFEKQSCCLVMLYEPDINVTDTAFSVSFSIREEHDSGLCLLLKLRDQEGITNILLMGQEDGTRIKEGHHKLESLVLASISPSDAYQIQGRPEWTFRSYKIDVQGKLEGIFAVSYFHELNVENVMHLVSAESKDRLSKHTDASENPVTASYSAFLGHMSVSNPHNHDVFCTVTMKCSKIVWERQSGKKVVSLLLTWNAEDLTDDQVLNYYVYVRKGEGSNDGKAEYVGVAMVKAFYVSHLPVPENCQELKFYLEIVCACGVLHRSEGALVSVPLIV